MPSILEILVLCLVEIISNPLAILIIVSIVLFFLLDGNL